MTATAKQLAGRRKYIGCSDLAILFGYKMPGGRTVADVWASKNYDMDQDQGNPSTEMGNLMEPVLLDWASKYTNLKIRKNQKRTMLPDLRLGALCDGIAEDGSPVEAKFVGRFSPYALEWGESYADQVPDPVVIQNTGQMMCCGSKRGLVVAMLGDRLPRLYEVPRNERLVGQIWNVVESFWKLTEPPPDPPPLESTMKLIRRVPGKTVQLDNEKFEIAQDWYSFRASRIQLEKREDEAKRKVLNYFGDAEAAKLADGTLVLTYYEQKSSPRVDLDKLKAHKQLYDKCVTQGTHRTLRVVTKTLEEIGANDGS